MVRLKYGLHEAGYHGYQASNGFYFVELSSELHQWT